MNINSQYYASLSGLVLGFKFVSLYNYNDTAMTVHITLINLNRDSIPHLIPSGYKKMILGEHIADYE